MCNDCNVAEEWHTYSSDKPPQLFKCSLLKIQTNHGIFEVHYFYPSNKTTIRQWVPKEDWAMTAETEQDLGFWKLLTTLELIPDWTPSNVQDKLNNLIIWM